jgi:hypothetical protein
VIDEFEQPKRVATGRFERCVDAKRLPIEHAAPRARDRRFHFGRLDPAIAKLHSAIASADDVKQSIGPHPNELSRRNATTPMRGIRSDRPGMQRTIAPRAQRDEAASGTNQ